MELLRAAVLDVPHGFPTRADGVSTGPFASLNCALHVGDDPDAVRENLTRLAAAAQVEPGALHTVEQVHGEAILRVPDEWRGGGAPAPVLGQADALVCATPGAAVGVRTADCVPVLLEDPVGKQVAAVHAGWRGVVAELLPKTIAALEATGASRKALRVAVGPCIRVCCFEVDDALAARFERAYGAAVIRREPGWAKPHVDLPAALDVQLDALGIPAAHRGAVAACTHCDARFFSHRRDQGRTGRHLSFITHAFATRL